MQRSRDFRRAQRAKRLKRIFTWAPKFDNHQDAYQWVVRMVQNPHPCSCYGCGNPRKHFGILTRQECQQADDLFEGWEEESRLGEASDSVVEGKTETEGGPDEPEPTD